MERTSLGAASAAVALIVLVVLLISSANGGAQGLIRVLAPSDSIAGGAFGAAVALGDVNADGVPDVAVGQPGGVPGRVLVHSGKSGEVILKLAADEIPQTADALGASLAVADVDGDGRGDVIAGAPDDPLIFDAPRAGRVLVFSGASGERTHGFVSPDFDDDARFGASVAAGDVNADGAPDVIVGAPFQDTPAGLAHPDGRVYVFSGADGALIRTLEPPQLLTDANLGAQVAAADLDGDGHADVIAGAPGEPVDEHARAGLIHAFSGADGHLLYSLKSPSPVAGAMFGATVAVGDGDGDAVADIVAADAGGVHVYSGADGSYAHTIPLPPMPLAPMAFPPFALATGDATGDSLADIAVGLPDLAPGPIAGIGAVMVFDGSDFALYRSFAPQPPTPGARFGSAIALADQTNDGHAELVIGAPGEPVRDAAAGRVYVFTGEPWPDGDGDGCRDSTELGPDPVLGGDRNPNRFWDFFEVTYDHTIDLADSLAILSAFGAAPGSPAYNALYDRYAPIPLRFWATASAGDGVDFSDALLNLMSFGHYCGP
jgi:hypothetical protein